LDLYGDEERNIIIPANAGGQLNKVSTFKHHCFVNDYLGNVRAVLTWDNSANYTVTQRNDYYAWGLPTSSSLNPEAQPYKREGKEYDEMHGLNWADFHTRHFDFALPSSPTMDWHAENYYSTSPYALYGNNPVNRIDPTGMDWYTDTDGTYQYNPDLTADNQSEILKKGQSYVGVTHQIKNKKGVITENYRSDGSIIYSSETAAYQRIWDNSLKTEKEEMAVIMDNGVLVLPNYKNGTGEADMRDYAYSVNNSGNVVDADGEVFNTLATVHTHPNGSGPSTYDVTDLGDLGLALLTPYKPVYVLQMNNRNRISFIVAAPNPSNITADIKRITYHLTAEYPKANIDALLKGTLSLRNYTKSNRNSFINNFK